ncbi:MAG: sulfite exporter TauE/SafE family protein [Gemmatimonadaceae bacterium]
MMLPATSLRLLLLVPLGLLALVFIVVLIKGLVRLRDSQSHASRGQGRIWPPSWKELSAGFVTSFFDTLGIGSFATTTALFRGWRLVPDELIPGTLNVGHTMSAVLAAFIFIQLVPVATTTLVPMIVASMLGAWLGAGVVSRLPRRRIRLGMGMALLAASGLLLLTVTGRLPLGGDALGLSGPQLATAVAGNFVFGALMTLGIGLYAPCMILISLLGMNPVAAFPIMMGSCAYLMTISSARFVRSARYSASAALGLTLGGVPALLLAAFVVKSLPITAVRWLVVVVVAYTGTMLLRAGIAERVPKNAILASNQPQR